MLVLPAPRPRNLEVVAPSTAKRHTIQTHARGLRHTSSNRTFRRRALKRHKKSLDTANITNTHENKVNKTSLGCLLPGTSNMVHRKWCNRLARIIDETKTRRKTHEYDTTKSETHESGTGRKSLTTREDGPCVCSTQSLISPTLLIVAESATISTVLGQLITDSSHTCIQSRQARLDDKGRELGIWRSNDMSTEQT